MIKNVVNLLSSFFNEKVIVEFKFRVRPREKMIAPPFTSKLVKSIIECCENYKFISEVYEKPVGGFRRVRYSVLFSRGGNPLYNTPGSRGVIQLLPWEDYNCRVTMVLDRSETPMAAEALEFSGYVKTPFGEVLVTPSSLSIVDLSSLLKAEPPSLVRVRMLTPTLIPQKLMMPPWASEKARKIATRYKLIPTPGLMSSSALRVIAGLSGNDAVVKEHINYYLGRAVDQVVVEMDYNIRPETAIYGRGGSGVLRKPRGVKGWILYECLSKGIARVFWTLLKTCELLGLGKSRCIGFGEVRVERVDRRGLELQR